MTQDCWQAEGRSSSRLAAAAAAHMRRAVRRRWAGYHTEIVAAWHLLNSCHAVPLLQQPALTAVLSSTDGTLPVPLTVSVGEVESSLPTLGQCRQGGFTP